VSANHQENSGGITRRRWLGAASLAGASSLLYPGFAMPNVNEPPTFVIYRGVNEPPPELIELKAGPLSVSFDPAIAFLRYVRLGGDEILRGVYSAVRDENWGTVLPRVKDLRIEQSGGGFDISFDVDCIDGPIDFRWAGKITGSPKGALRFSMDGAAHSTFLRNRLGFCVLHPVTCAGRDCAIEKVDGSVEKGSFPELISPHQPFFDIRAITHEVIPGVEAEVRMEGDTFESEDQRNWTDASYKTYCTPLSDPKPVEVVEGARVRQAVTVTLKAGGRLPSAAVRRPEVVLEVTGGEKPLPKIGFGLSNSAPLLNEAERDRLRALKPAHLRVDLHLNSPDWKDQLRRAATGESLALKAPLEVAAHITGDAETQLGALAAEARNVKALVDRWLVFQEGEDSTADKWIALAKQHLPGQVGGGATTNFTELNRGRPESPGDIVAYPANPQVHAFDDRSIVEVFPGQRATVRTARSFCGGAEVAVTPIALTAGPNHKVDPRQMSLLGAGWTLGCIQAFAESGADSLTFYETVGGLGLMETKTGSRFPDRFRSIPGAVYPLYHVFADLADCGGGSVTPVGISDPLKVAALAVRPRGSKRRERLLLANLTADVQYLRIRDEDMLPGANLRTIDERSAIRAMTQPGEFRKSAPRCVSYPSPGEIEIALLPFSYMRVDSTGRAQ